MDVTLLQIHVVNFKGGNCVTQFLGGKPHRPLQTIQKYTTTTRNIPLPPHTHKTKTTGSHLNPDTLVTIPLVRL